MFPDIPEYQIFELTPNTVAKRTWEMDEDAVDSIEANALKIVFEKTTILWVSLLDKSNLCDCQ